MQTCIICGRWHTSKLVCKSCTNREETNVMDREDAIWLGEGVLFMSFMAVIVYGFGFLKLMYQ